MLVTPFGMETLERFWQFSKAESPILIKLFGSTTFVRAVQPQNALPSMVVTPSEIVMLTTPEKKNAPDPIVTTGRPPTDDGIVTIGSGPVYPVTVSAVLFVA